MGADRCFSATWIPGQQRFKVTGQVGFEGEKLDDLYYELAEQPEGLPSPPSAPRTSALPC